MITLSKLAKMAHVSLSTASKAFSMSSDVSAETRKIIFDLAKEYGCFKKFYNAKYHKFVVAIICPELRSQSYMTLAALLQEELSRRNCEVCVASTDFSLETEEKLLTYYYEYSNVDGIIVIGGKASLKEYGEIPIISITPYVETFPQTLLRVDKSEAVSQMLLYFRDAGVENIGFIGEARTKSKQRLFQKKRKEIFGTPEEDFVCVASCRFEEGGYEAMKEILSHPVRPRAILCAYDYMAMGAVRCLKDHGFSVPEDMAIVGMDNISSAPFLDPPLASIGAQKEELCRLAAKILVERLQDGTLHSGAVLQSEFCMRRSAEIEENKK